MKEQEQKDLDAMRTEMTAIKSRTIEYLLHCQRNGIAHSGYATIESLVMGTLARCQADIDKLTKAHIKKYPDDK